MTVQAKIELAGPSQDPYSSTAAEAPAQLGHVKKMLIGAHLYAVPGTSGARVLSLGCTVDFRSL